MTRIIAGFAGSLRLGVPPSGTRPTSDRVREAVFSSVEARHSLEGCAVLDLYAGSGALGLEAVSRGAAAATLVERAQPAARVARRNAAIVAARAPRGSTPRVDVVALAVSTYLESATGQFDVVFIDPPYDLANPELERVLSLLAPLLADDALVVVERRARDDEPSWPSPLVAEKRKVYGDTAVYWLEPAGA